MSCPHRTKQEWVALLSQGSQAWNQSRRTDPCRLDLQHVTLKGTPGHHKDLRGFQLNNIDFSQASWQHVQADGVSFIDCNFSDCHFNRVSFRGASFARTTLTGSTFPGCDFSKADLVKAKGLLSRQLAGISLAGAQLPRGLNFDVLAKVDARITKAAHFFALLLTVMLYTWFAIQVSDKQLILGSKAIDLPIINAQVSVAQLFRVGPVLMLLLQGCYFFVLYRVWQAITSVPLIFPDGFLRQDKIHPWLPISFVCNVPAKPGQRLWAWFCYLCCLSLPSLLMFSFWLHHLRRHDLGTSYYLIMLLILSLLSTIVFFSFIYKRFLLNPTNREQLTQFWRGNLIALALITTLAFGLHQISWQVNQSAKPFSLLASFAYVDLTFDSLVDKPENWFALEALQKSSAYKKLEPSNLQKLDLNLNHAQADSLFLAKAKLNSASFIQANLKEAVFRGITLANGKQALFSGAKAQGADFHHAKLASAKFNGANLEKATFFGNDLNYADFSEATLTNTRFMGKEESLTSLIGANFSGAIFGGTLFRDVDLSGATFFNISRAQPILFQNARLLKSTWTRPKNSTQSLSGQSFLSLKMADSVFAGNTLIGCLFNKSDLQSANFSNSELFWCDLSEADLKRADFTGSSLNQSKFFFANLSNAVLSQADLTDAKLDYAILNSATQLTEAILDSTSLEGTLLYGVDLSGCHQLLAEQLVDACIDVTTQLPFELSEALLEIRDGNPVFHPDIFGP